MNFDDYQRQAMSSAVYPMIGSNIVYPVLGVNGEAGEVAEKVKKIIRDKHGVWDDQDRDAISKEIGDILWYCAALCSELGLSMTTVAERNIEKLSNRMKNDTVHGEGDDR
jgi:NTP pyrophosphatase (non-canonical NTP hydrolase)